MKVKEFKEYILNHMTADEALTKLLEGTVLTYESLKFDEGKEVHPLLIISMAACDMGWQIAVERGQDDVRGVAVGTAEYMETIFKK